MGCNRTVPPCIVGRPGSGRPSTCVTDDDRRQSTPTDDIVQNNTGPLGGPVITQYTYTCNIVFECTFLHCISNVSSELLEVDLLSLI